jgi:hypothetical protein
MTASEKEEGPLIRILTSAELKAMREREVISYRKMREALVYWDESHDYQITRGDHRYWMWQGRQLARRDYHPTKEPTCQNSQPSNNTNSNSPQKS